MSEETLFKGENEQALLAILLKDEDRVYDAVSKLTPEMFWGKPSGKVFDAMSRLISRQIAPSIQTLRIELESAQELDNVGGTAYLDMLLQQTVEQSAYPMLVEAISDDYKKMKLYELAGEIPTLIKNYGNINDVTGRIQEHMSVLESKGVANGVKPIEVVLSEAWEKLQERMANPGISGITTGFPSLDFYTGGFMPGTEWIFSSRPSHGKTTTMLAVIKAASKEADVPALIFNREMNAEELMYRMLAMDRGIKYQKIKTGNLTENDKDQLRIAVKKISKLPIYLDSNYYGDINYVINAIRKYHRRYGIRLVGIDYIQLLADRTKDQVSELGRISRDLKLLAMDLGITNICLSQLNRRAEERDDKRPVLADLRASGNLEEDADVVVGLYREEMYKQNSPEANKIEFIILKQRNGPLKTLRFDFKGSYLQIIDRADETDFTFGDD